MKRLVWTTDIHLNFLSAERLDAFFRGVRDARPDALLVGGDIAEADTLERYLVALERHVEAPIYFVLGNHDFYRGSIADVRRRVSALAARSERLCWLPEAGVVELSPRVGLVGHDGFYDARLGDGWGSTVQMSDFVLIRELAWLDKADRLERLNALGDEAAEFFRRTLAVAFDRYDQVLVLTHVPPFREACWYEGAISDDEWLPFFTCKAAGDAMLEAMEAHPTKRMVVLCGHTHGDGFAQVLPNLAVHTGRAEYGAPELQPMVTLDDEGRVRLETSD